MGYARAPESFCMRGRMTGSFRLKAAILAASIAAGAAGTAEAVEPAAPERLIDKEYVTLIALRNGLDGKSERKLTLTKAQLKTLGSYYGSVDARLIWVSERGLDAREIAGLKAVFGRAAE